MIESIEREGTKVVLKINLGLDISKPVLWFEYGCTHEYVAELVKDRLWDQLDKFKKKIAEQALYILEQKDISKLKSTLVNEWDGSKHCWK